MQFDKNILMNMHRELLRVRHAELALAERYKQQEMRTPTHFGVGQEAVAVGVCAALENTDVAYSHHRSHNHFLAKGGSVYKLAAELFGRETGCSRGRGGSVHLTDRSCGFIASSAILGEAMAVATGSALSFKMDKNDRVSTAFFGDAVAEEGAFYECLSYAALKELPVLYICENNGYATESTVASRQPKDVTILGRVKSFGIEAIKVDGNNVREVYAAAHGAVTKMKKTSQPIFLECHTYRWLEHVGPHSDVDMKRDYRSSEELESWKARCPIQENKKFLLDNYSVEQSELDNMALEIEQSIQTEIEKAYQDPWPSVDSLMDNT